MHSNKGFTLVELMIVVAIIGVLSLISFPVYEGYVVRTKVTEKFIIHMNLMNNLTTEYEIGGNDGLLSYVLSLCTDKPRFGIGSVSLGVVCKTNAGLIPDADLDFRYRKDSNGGGLIIEKRGNTSNPNEFSFQNLHLSESGKNQFAPDGTYYQGGQLYFRFDNISKIAFAFMLHKTSRGLSNGNYVVDKHGSRRDPDLGKWYCASGKMKDGKLDFRNVSPLDRSFRPKVCSYGFNEITNYFYEDQ